MSKIQLTWSKLIPLKKYDIVVLSTDHDCFDYELIARNSKLIVDTRNAFERHGIREANIFKA